MAIAYCRSCKQKITQRDSVCPRCGCGSPNSRVVPILVGFVVLGVCAVLYSALKRTTETNTIEVVVSPATKAASSLPENVVAGSED